MHPVSRRCSSVEYSRFAPSSRLAGRAPRRPRCVTVFMKGTTTLSDPFRKDHIVNVTNDPARRRIAEGSIVDKSLRHARRPGPPSHRRRLVLMRHVDVKAIVGCDLEKRHATGIRQRPVCRESSNGGFQRLDICRPGAGEKPVRGLDRQVRRSPVRLAGHVSTSPRPFRRPASPAPGAVRESAR